MAGQVYCPRCQTKVILEQDGRSCSNCAKVLVIRAPNPPAPRPRTEVRASPKEPAA